MPAIGGGAVSNTNMTGVRLAYLALVAALVGAAGQTGGGALTQVERSSDVPWLERIAMSAEFAAEVQRSSRIGMAKALRTAAYARLGELATTDSLAAIERIDRALAGSSLTPRTVRADVWPTIGWHMGDSRVMPLAETTGRDGLTYAIVAGDLLGRTDFFLISSATPADRGSWSRPVLIGPSDDLEMTPATLTWEPGTLRFRFTTNAAPRDMRIVLADVLRDSDSDGWTDLEEARLGTDPHQPDTDRDGIPDGADVCPLFAAPARPPSEDETILQKAIFAAFGLSGSRQLLYVTPGCPKVHVAGYAGPIVYDREIPKDGAGGGPYVTWKIARKSATEAVVELTDWEGLLAAGGQDVVLKNVAGRWVVVARHTTWVS